MENVEKRGSGLLHNGQSRYFDNYTINLTPLNTEQILSKQLMNLNRSTWLICDNTWLNFIAFPINSLVFLLKITIENSFT